MPSSSDEQRNQMIKWFGDIDTDGPYSFLRRHGYTEKGGMLIKPTSAHTVSADEWECICFLADEWDFGFDPGLELGGINAIRRG